MSKVCLLSLFFVPLVSGYVLAQPSDPNRPIVIQAATWEAVVGFSSAPLVPQLLNNVMHEKYGGCTDPEVGPYSLFYDEWPFGGPPLYLPLAYSWCGTPYSFGGDDLQVDAQPKIYAGSGVGAHICHYSGAGDEVDSWAAGIDCADFVGQVLGIGSSSTQPGATNSLWSNVVELVFWSRLRPADIILKVGHVRMFEQWYENELSYFAIEAAQSEERVAMTGPHYVVDEVASGYAPMRPTVFSDIVAISDIAAFWVESNDYNGIRLGYRINESASPTDSAAIYISDNPLGPARLIRNSAEIPVLDDTSTPELETNYWSYYPLHDDYYHYYLNHEEGPFPVALSPSALFENEDNPVYWYWYDTDRPVLDPPGSVFSADVPLDRGHTLLVQWEISDADSIVDCYNIYRSESLDVATDFVYVASVSAGTNSFTDEHVIFSRPYSYKISAAHHGSSTPSQPGYTSYGLWNDFSGPSSWSEPVDNLAIRHFSISGQDTLTTCPSGDGDTLKVELTIMGSDVCPTENVPADSIRLLIAHDSGTIFCHGDTLVALADTDEHGRTKFICSAIGGCGTVHLTAEVMSIPLLDTLTVVIRSPDYNGDGLINLQDLSRFAAAYPPTRYCEDPEYDTCADFNLDCVINLQDLAIFGAHNMDDCQP